MSTMVTGFRRSTRYQLVPEGPFLVCYEYDESILSVEQIKQITSKEWSKKILGGAISFEEEVWDEIAVAGDV